MVKSESFLNLDHVYKYVKENISVFHSKRLEKLQTLKLSDVLKSKNPYMFRAKNINTAQDIIVGILNARISSSEETIFGDWLEGLAIFVNGKVYGGKKSGIKSIDLEFDQKGKRFLVSIKSSSNWSNSTSQKKMEEDFDTAKKTIRSSGSKLEVIAIDGCCYGTDNNPDKGGHFKYCGQKFWEFISGDSELFINIIEPLAYKAKEKNDEFNESYNRTVNLFTKEFSLLYCTPEGVIDWQKLVIFNSGIKKKKKKKKKGK